MSKKYCAKVLLGSKVIGVLLLSTAYADVTYTTSKGAVFRQIQGPSSFGKAWEDPTGMLWSANYNGNYANYAIKPDQNKIIIDSPATEACTSIGGSLPSIEDYKKLDSYFDMDKNQRLTDQGRKDMFAIFADMKDRSFWSSSVDKDGDDVTWLYLGDNGFVPYNYGFRDTQAQIRCVVQKTSILNL